MSQPQARKEFVAERYLRRRRGDGQPATEGAPFADLISNSELLEAISALREEVAALKNGAPPAEGSAAGERKAAPIPENINQKDMGPDAADVRIEIARMVREIGTTKRELSSIKHPLAGEDRILRASNELDAIVEATERATHQILDLSENIDEVIKRIEAAHEDDGSLQNMTGEIANHLITIMENCNFQDITGQRVSKVIKTIRFIEERILTMIDIWGIDAFADLPVPKEEKSEDGETGHGPALANEGITQEDIDALFD